MGETVFEDATVPIYEREGGEGYKLVRVKAGTVIIDASLISNRSDGRFRYTCAHELAHYVLHKEIYTKSGEIAAMTNVVRSSEADDGLEWQAVRLGSYFLMPKGVVKMAFYRNHNDRNIIDTLAVLFGVSRQAVCSWHHISETVLKTVIIGELQSHVQAITLDEVALLEKLKKQMNLDDSEQQNLLRQEAKKLTHRLSELTQITADLYEDKVTGKISEVTFTALMNKNEKERQNRQAQHDVAQNHLSETQAKVLSMTKWAEVIKRHIHLTDLCRADVEELIDHIEIGESDYSSGARQQEIKIYWRFIGCLNT